MPGRKVRKGRGTLLPITGQKITEIAFGQRGPVKLVFGDRYDTEIRIEDAITLRRGESERGLTGSSRVLYRQDGSRLLAT